MRKAWITCNACGADDYQQISLAAGEWPIGKCRKCGLIYVNPIPFFDPTPEFSEVSKDFQYTRYMHGEITQDILRHERRQLRSHLRAIERIAGKTSESVRFLDVGCGSGASVGAATEMGWKAVGIDIDPELIRNGKNQLNVDLRCTPLLESGFPDESFDFVRLRDVIEHLPNPYECLVEIRRILAPGGVALFATPNEDSIPARLKRVVKGKRDTVATVTPPHHIHGFTPKTLELLFGRAGFKTLQITTTTPVDRHYVTSNNMNAASMTLRKYLWAGSKTLGKGSMLIGWAAKS